MPEKLYALTEDDREAIADLIAERMQEQRNPRQQARRQSQSYQQAPGTYVVKTPSSGIPGMVSTVPASANCDIYQIIPDGTNFKLQLVSAASVAVFNTSSTPISANTWVIVTRDAFGKWLLSGSGTGGSLPRVVILDEYDDYLKCISYEFVDGDPAVYNEHRGRLTVTGALWAAGVYTFGTLEAHGLAPGDIITVEDSNPATWDGSFTVLGIIDSFNFTATTTFVSDPGTWIGCSTIIDEQLVVWVAKPYLLRRTPWDKQLVQADTDESSGSDEGSGTASGTGFESGKRGYLYYTYPTDTLDVGERNVQKVVPMKVGCDFILDGAGNYILTSSESYDEAVTPPYFRGDIITVASGNTAVRIGPGNPTGTGIGGLEFAELTDINDGGRCWQKISSGSGIDVATVVAPAATAHYYDAALFQYSPTGTPLVNTGVKIWLYDFMQVTTAGLSVLDTYAAIKTGKSLKIGGETRPVYLGIGGWLSSVACTAPDSVTGGTY